MATHKNLKGATIIMTGPSGAGKSTMINKLQEEFSGIFGFSVSHTTRGPREGEIDGREYNFTTRDDMLTRIAAGEFIEHADFGGNMYGTSKAAIAKIVEKGLVPLLDIEMKGCEQVRKSDLNCVFISILPPSLEICAARLTARGTETVDKIEKRVAVMASAIEYGSDPKNFDHIIVNDNKDEAYAKLRQAILPIIEQSRRQGA